MIVALHYDTPSTGEICLRFAFGEQRRAFLEVGRDGFQVWYAQIGPEREVVFRQEQLVRGVLRNVLQ